MESLGNETLNLFNKRSRTEIRLIVGVKLLKTLETNVKLKNS